MAETFQFDLVSPERKLASLQASAVQIPGADGDFTAMANHAPFMTTLRPGVLQIEADKDGGDYIVTGGFVEISASGASVLAEKAVPLADASREMVEGLVADAEAAAGAAADVDVAAKRVADLKALLDRV